MLATDTNTIVNALTGPNPPRTAIPSDDNRQSSADRLTLEAVPLAAPPSSQDIDPEQIPKTLADLNQAVVRSYDLTATKAGDLNIPIFGSIGGNQSRRVVVLERAQYKSVVGKSGTEYELGYAIRLCLTLNKWDVTTKTSLPFLAASAQMGQIEAGWILQVLGLTGARLAEVAAPPTELNVETFVIAKQSLTALINAVNDPSTQFVAYPITAKRSSDQQDQDYRRAAAVAFALSRIARRSTLQDTLNRIRSQDADIDSAIQDVYDVVANGGPGDKPSDQAVRKSLDLLGGIEADV